MEKGSRYRSTGCQINLRRIRSHGEWPNCIWVLHMVGSHTFSDHTLHNVQCHVRGSIGCQVGEVEVFCGVEKRFASATLGGHYLLFLA